MEKILQVGSNLSIYGSYHNRPSNVIFNAYCSSVWQPPASYNHKQLSNAIRDLTTKSENSYQHEPLV